jgi:hypothetical protein
MRRVVIAHNSKNESVVAHDEEISTHDMPGVGVLYRVWSADEPSLYPDSGTDPDAPGVFPPVGGFRVQFCKFEPGQRAEPTVAADEGGARWDENGMHVTDTTDFSVVMDGEIMLGIDNGTEITLRKGDTTVMAGARHYWRNASEKPAMLVFFMVGARRAQIGPSK